MRKAVQNEVNAQNDNMHFMWRQDSKRAKGLETKLMIETNDLIVSRLIAKDGHALTPDERSQDDARVEHLLQDPDALQKKRQEQHEDADRVNRILKSLPDAFLFKFVGVEPNGKAKDIHYSFEPNPNFRPPNRETMVFQGMKGDLYIDQSALRIAKIDATLFRDVPFGWGILGRLNKGGRFLVEQCRIEDGHWETTHSILSFTGKILLFKSLNIQQEDTLSEFRRMPDKLTVAQGLEHLKRVDDLIAKKAGN